MELCQYTAGTIRSVHILSEFWLERLECIRKRSVPAVIESLKTTGRLYALTWTPETAIAKVHPFWDSDVYKTIEACCYLLMSKDDVVMREFVDEGVEIIEKSQLEDGYLNSYITTTIAHHRFTNLRDLHELYQLGHLCEAAVGYQLLTGSPRLVEVAMRFIRYVVSIFGPGEGLLKGYPGHEEMEIGLMRLYDLTGDQTCLDLAEHFIFERGKMYEGKNYFEQEMQNRHGDPEDYLSPEFRPHYQAPRDYAYHQAHAPLHDQDTIEGHCVRAMYFLTAATWYVYKKKDTKTLESVYRLFKNTTRQKMYITGGIGSIERSEGFAPDYWLPDQEGGGCAYAETCASFALVLLCHQLLLVELRGEYGDVMERALYNVILGALSMDGTSFYYQNPLTTLDGRPKPRSRWFDVACCPPNVAKLFGLLPQLIWATSKESIVLHQYISSSFKTTISGREITTTQTSGMPWTGDITVFIQGAEGTKVNLIVRVPSWAKGYKSSEEGVLIDGYLHLQVGTELHLTFPCTPRKVFANPLTRKDEVALARGPLVYCAENVDNPGVNLEILGLRGKDIEESETVVAGVTVRLLRVSGEEKDMDGWEESLYDEREVKWKGGRGIVFVPYFLRQNRGGRGGMRVWLKHLS